MTAENQTLEEQIAEAVKLLAAAGFKLSIDGCGCCGSPNVRLDYNDRQIIGEWAQSWHLRVTQWTDRSNVNFNMFTS